MSIELCIARWFAVFSLLCGLSHVLHPAIWTRLLLPLRDRDTGGLVLAGLSLPAGLGIVLGHNVWVWDLPVVVTLVGWMLTLKGASYALIPRAHRRVMLPGKRLELGIRAIGVVMVAIGVLTGYDAFFRR